MPGLVAADGFDLFAFHAAHVNAPLGEFSEQHLVDLVDLEVVVGIHSQRVLGVFDARIRATEVEAGADFLVGLLERVAQFDLVNFGNNVETGHGVSLYFLPARLAPMRSRNAFRRIKPAASAWLYAPLSSSNVAMRASKSESDFEARPTTRTVPL